jgi:hypothetical protein
MLHINRVHSQRQRLLVLAHGNKTRTQVAERFHIEGIVMLSVKLFQSPLQQRNPLAEIILKQQPLTSQASRALAIGYTDSCDRGVVKNFSGVYAEFA